MVLAADTITSFLDGPYKTQAILDITCSGVKLAKQLCSQQDIDRDIITEVVDFAYLAPCLTSLVKAIVSKLMSFLAI